MKAKHQRLWFIVVSVILLCIAVLFALQAFKENIVYFFSPSELVAQNISSSMNIRIGGLVKADSVSRNDARYVFIITDGARDVTVEYTGLMPNLFREGQGVIAEGHMHADGHFAAQRILAKHDETYMPREVIDALKDSGVWRGPREGAE